MYCPYRIVFPTNISKPIPLSIKQTWVHYPNLGSPTSHGHNSLTVRSYVMFPIPPKMECHVIPIYNTLTFKYIKNNTIIHQTRLGPLTKPLCYRNLLPDFLQGLTSMTNNTNNQQYPPLALMETLWCNTEVMSLILPLYLYLYLYLCIYLCIW